MRHAIAVVAVVAVFAPPARAEDPNKAELDALAAEVDKEATAAGKIKKGDRNGGNAALKRVSKLLDRIYNAKDRALPEWAATVHKAQDLEVRIYELVAGQKPPETKVDDATKKAIGLLDGVAKEIETGDPATLQAKIKEAKTLLFKTQARRTNEWIDSVARADALDHQAHKRAAAAPAPKPTPEPKPEAPSKPAEPAPPSGPATLELKA